MTHLYLSVLSRAIAGVTNVNEAPCKIGNLDPIEICNNVANPAAKNIELMIRD